MIHKMVAAVNFQNVFSKRFAASVPVRLVGWLCVVLLSGALLSGSDSILRWALFLFAGLSPALALKTSYTVTELAAASVALSLGLLAAVAGTTALIGCYSTIVPYMLVISVAAACAVLVSRRTRVVLAKRELYAALVAISVSAALALTYGSNGPVATPRGLSYIVRHWLRRDGAYFFALVQQAIERGAIPHENPFIAGIPAYYATLGHCGLALLAPGKSVPAAVSLWGVLPLLHVAAVLLFYHFTVRLLVQYRAQRPERWALAAIALFCAWRPDFYTYPQSQSAFMPLLAWFCWWTLRPAFLRRSFDQGLALLWLILMAWIHTVSSVVALCFACGATVSRWRSTREQKPKRRRLFPVFMWLSGIAVAAWLTTHVGDAPYRDPVTKLSFLGVHLLNNHLFPHSILYIAGALALFAAWQHRRYGEFSTLALLLACGMGYTARGVCNVEAFSQFFGIFNAQRFPYFALLLVLPLTISSFPRVRYVVVSGLAVNLILAPSQPVEECRLLVSGKPLVFTPADLQLYDTIRHQTAPQAKFVTNAEHWGLPLFTGRCEFARGPVPAFGLHGLPSQTVYYLFSLRENFVHGTQCNKYWQVIETFTPVEYVIVENIAKPASQTLMRCLEDAVFDKGRFRKLWETPNAVTYRWVVEPTYE